MRPKIRKSSQIRSRMCDNHTQPSLRIEQRRHISILVLSLYTAVALLTFCDGFLVPTTRLKHSACQASTFSHSSEGLSKLHRSILSRTLDRQRFVTGKYPLTVTVRENPTRKWLSAAGTEVLVNGTSPLRSLASLDRFHWLDEQERQLQYGQGLLVMELLAEIHTERPGYLQVLPAHAAGELAAKSRQQRVYRWNQESDDNQVSLDGDRLWVTGFSLAGRKGLLKSIDCDCGTMTSVNSRTATTMLWPNEVVAVPENVILGGCETAEKLQECSDSVFRASDQHRDALLVCDGFLVPGKDRGGIYVIQHPGDPQREWTIRLTPHSTGWFYHRAVWMDLTGDGRQSILTARAKVSTVLSNHEITAGMTKTGELVWLECPKPAMIEKETGTPLEADGTVFDPFSARHLPWKTRVLVRGPDVMFSMADFDLADNTVEVIASQFFGKQVKLYSIERGPLPRVVFDRVIDDCCGSAFGCVLANLDCNSVDKPTVVDSGSTAGLLKQGDSFSHVLVTSHECSYTDKEDWNAVERSRSPVSNIDDGGSLFAYRVPPGHNAWKTQPWSRTTIASGFKVRGQIGNMVNPGAPGFVYTFYAQNGGPSRIGERPLIAVAGDCAESAFLFRPEDDRENLDDSSRDPSTNYSLMVEIACGSTVGSIGIGYKDFNLLEQETGYAKIFIPCYEKDKILVFGLGSGEGEDGDDGW